jgi:hypothetical protein
MKKSILTLVLLAFVACKSVKENPNVLVITSKEEVVMNDYVILINTIISDSRCPEGMNCIWAGELVLELRVLKNDEIKEKVVLTFSPKTEEENLAWFGKYMTSNKKLINYNISPTKTQKPLELKDYKIELILE